MVTKILTCNYSIAEAVKQSRVQVIAAYPITPQTTIVEALSKIVKKGELNANYIRVESEHSAMAACIGASSVGVRTFTATSSHGLAYMHELLYWASASRLPIVMVNVNRALGPPWNIWTEHTDSLIERDTGWIQLYASSNQEAYDLVFQSYKLAESKDIFLPIMICIDGFILSHTSSPVDLIEQKLIDEFLPSYNPDPSKQFILDVNKPTNFGNIVPTNCPDDYFYEYRYLANEAMINSEKKFIEIAKDFNKLIGRNHGGLTYSYQCDDAEIILVSIGTLFNQCITAVNILRKKGQKIGALKIRSIRPFPTKEIIKISKQKKALLVIDRDLSFGIGGMVAWDIKSALFDAKNSIELFSGIAGLGGRDINVKEIIFFVDEANDVLKNKKIKKDFYWIGLRRNFIGKNPGY